MTSLAHGSGVVLALIARPLVVLATLGTARLSWAERAFITWSGLKGAVPILLAAFAVLEHVSGAGRIYSLVFVVVLLSVAVQGTLVPLAAAVLRIPMHVQPALPWELSIRLGAEPPAAHEFEVADGAIAAGCRIRDLPLGDHAWVTLVVRDGAATRAGGSLQLRAGDRVLLLTDEPEPLARLFSAAHAEGV